MAGQLRSQVHVEGRRCGRGLLGCLAPPDISAILGSVCLAWLFVARQKYVVRREDGSLGKRPWVPGIVQRGDEELRPS